MAQFEKVKRQVRLLWVPILLGTITAISLAVQLANPVSSTDLWWHMLHGRQILESGSLITDHSLFTWTPAITYFPYTSWLGQIVLYLTYDLAGSAGLMALRYGIFFLIFLLGWRYAVVRGIATNPITWLVIVIAISLTWQAPLIKTELFTVGFYTIVVWLYFHIRYRGDQAWKLTYLFPLLMIIWVNTHGAFAIASIFFAATAIGEILNSRFCPEQAMAPRLQKHYFIALALCFPAIFMTPFGYDLPYSIIKEVLLSNIGFHGRISGYIPTYRFNVPPYYILEYMIVAMLLYVMLLWQKLKNKITDWVVILAFLGYCAIFTQLARVTFFLGPVFLFICLDLLAEKKNSWAWSTSRVTKPLVAAICISITALIGWRIVSFYSCKLLSFQDGIKQVFSINPSLPIAETEYIKQNLPGQKVGNMYRDGGYLLYHLWPEKKAMIDTRYFPFRAWINDYFDFVDGVNMDKFVEDHPADYWLVNYQFNNPFYWFNHSDAWKPAFLGPSGAVFVPAESAPETPKIVSDIGSKINLAGYSYAFRAALKLNNLRFARYIHQASQQIQEPFCDEHIILTGEMGETISGLQAYNEGKYEEAYRILRKNKKYIYTQSKAADGLMKLAEQSWNNEDMHGARNWYLKIFEMMPNLPITDIYNFTLIDWHYRFTNSKEFIKPEDNWHWQRLVAYILTQEDKIPQSQKFILETAKAMKEGRYDGTSSLVPRYPGMAK